MSIKVGGLVRRHQGFSSSHWRQVIREFPSITPDTVFRVTEANGLSIKVQMMSGEMISVKLDALNFTLVEQEAPTSNHDFQVGNKVVRHTDKEASTWTGPCARRGFNPEGEFTVVEVLRSHIKLEGFVNSLFKKEKFNNLSSLPEDLL